MGENDVMENNTEDVSETDSEEEMTMGDLSGPALTISVQMPVEILYSTVFGDDTTFYESWMNKSLAFDIEMGDWQEASDDYPGSNGYREMDYKVKLEEKSMFITEDYVNLKTKQVLYVGNATKGDDYQYIVDNHNYMSGIPFSNTFHYVARHSFKSISLTETDVRVSCELRFTSEPWAMVKTQLENSVFSGFKTNYQLLEDLLVSTFEYEDSTTYEYEDSTNADDLSAYEDSTSTTTAAQYSATPTQDLFTIDIEGSAIEDNDN